MNRKKRQHIPKVVRDLVRDRQKGTCVCCVKRGERFHHVYAVAFSKYKIHSFGKNIVLLCLDHHNLFHLGDPDTFQAIYEYVWYLYFRKLPEEQDIIDISNQVVNIIKEDIEKRTQYFSE